MKKALQEELLDDYYNLLINPMISDEERQLLLIYKEKLSSNKNLEKTFSRLASEIRDMSVKNINRHKKLTKDFSEFYKKISYIGQQSQQVGRGLILFGIVR